ncbi:MAG: NADH-ubiquinone oxidoreductase-F iron-sulfur binding region domain-containing protein [Nitrospirota bacterium]|nr:NADH-ubiquinone oxidoreductase-F iron-sulfur binding region domain-containing protein [Nitrospirota bacterium]
MSNVKEKKVEEIKKEAEAKKCPVSKSLYYIEEFLAGPMCGKCFPCEMGIYEARIRLKNLTEGKGSEADIFAIKRIASDMLESSRCKRGKDTATFILEWMGTDVFKEHSEGKCPGRECIALIEYRIIPEDCIMCGLCLDACKDNAITGEKKKKYQSGYLPFEIRQKRCTKCGDCIGVCPTNAIIIVDVKSKEPVGV